MCICACVCVCVCRCVIASVCMCVCVCMCICVHVYVCVGVHVLTFGSWHVGAALGAMRDSRRASSILSISTVLLNSLLVLSARLFASCRCV